jgi:O-antigen ligase
MLKKLLLLISALTPLYLVRFSLGIPTNLFEILLLIAIFAFAFKRKTFDLTIFKRNRFFTFALLALLVGLIISIAYSNNYLTGLGILKSWFVFPIIFALIIQSSWEKPSDLKLMLRLWFYAWSLLAIFALIGFAFDFQTYDGRLAFIYDSPNYFAMLLAPAIIFGIYLIKHSDSNKQKTVLWICQLIVMAALYLTYSYAAWFSILIAICFQLMPKDLPRTRLFKFLAFFFLFAIFLVSTQFKTSKFQDLISLNERSSLSSRTMIWKAATKIISNNPVIGIGPGNFQMEYLKYQKYFPPYLEWAVPQPHNLLLAFWLQSGILGLLGFILIMLNVLYTLIKNSNELSIMLASYFIYLMLHGLIDTPIWKNDLSFIFWVLIFAALFVSKKQRIQTL